MRMTNYAVVFEKTESNRAAFVPDPTWLHPYWSDADTSIPVQVGCQPGHHENSALIAPLTPPCGMSD